MSKKVIRIISFVLVIVTLLGFIIPYVSATELDKEESDAVTDKGVVGETPESLYGTPPEGFELIVEDDYYRVEKTDSNLNVWFQIPITNETPRLNTVAFIVDINKNMVIEQIELNVEKTYVNGLKLADGHYALITGNYAFGDANNKYEINAGKPVYFYIGDTALVDQSKYGVTFHVVDTNAITLTLDAAGENAVLAADAIHNSDVVIPEEITKMTNGDIVDIEPDVDPNKPTDPIEPEKPTEPEKPKREFFLWTVIKNSWVWLILLAGTAVWYKVVVDKKREKLIKTTESDRNDKGRFE